MNPLLLIFVRIIAIVPRNTRLKVLLLVLLNVTAIVLSVLGVGALFVGLKIILNPAYFEELVMSMTDSFSGDQLLNLSSLLAGLLVCAPGLVAMLVSSLLTKHARESLAGVVNDAKVRFERVAFQRSNIAETPQAIVLSTSFFGLGRAIFLNLFVILQSLVAFLTLLFVAPLLSLCVLGVMLLFKRSVKKGFSKLKSTKSPKTDFELDDATDDGLGMGSPQSFRRLELARFIGRNYGIGVLVLIILSQVVLELTVQADPDLLFVLLYLGRLIGQVFVPFAVLQMACMPTESGFRLISDHCAVVYALEDQSFSTGDQSWVIAPSSSSRGKDQPEHRYLTQKFQKFRGRIWLNELKEKFNSELTGKRIGRYELLQ